MKKKKALTTYFIKVYLLSFEMKSPRYVFLRRYETSPSIKENSFKSIRDWIQKKNFVILVKCLGSEEKKNHIYERDRVREIESLWTVRTIYMMFGKAACC